MAARACYCQLRRAKLCVTHSLGVGALKSLRMLCMCIAQAYQDKQDDMPCCAAAYHQSLMVVVQGSSKSLGIDYTYGVCDCPVGATAQAVAFGVTSLLGPNVHRLHLLKAYYARCTSV